MVKRQLIAAAQGGGLRLQRGELLRIIDPEGGQSGDLLAFSQDGSERFSNGRTFDYVGLRAEMDLVIALSACPSSTCNGGAPPRPLAYEVLSE